MVPLGGSGASVSTLGTFVALHLVSANVVFGLVAGPSERAPQVITAGKRPLVITFAASESNESKAEAKAEAAMLKVRHGFDDER